MNSNHLAGVHESAEFLQKITDGYAPRDFSVRFWDGSEWKAETGPRFTLVLNHPGALRGMFWPPRELTLGAAYVNGDFEVEGNLESAFALSDFFAAKKWNFPELLKTGRSLRRLPRKKAPVASRGPADFAGAKHSRARDRLAISYHYDVSNEFFASWLDSRMVYSSAYFARPEEDLETAQANKLDYVCRKLRLVTGEKLLDIGCGWGGLIMHASRNCGAEALGITLSRLQADFVRNRIRRDALEKSCRAELLDYRDVTGEGRFDKIVSVGMFEHVGDSKLLEYFQKAWKLLKPGGVFLNHGIALGQVESSRAPSFVDKYVFPDGELFPISHTLHAAEAAGFEVRDVECLREHYAMTLRHWVRRLEANAAAAIKAGGETAYRVWRLFMSGSAYAFQTGRNNVYQALLVKTDKGRSGLPLTRADWYR